jgi:hypothetical protein
MTRRRIATAGAALLACAAIAGATSPVAGATRGLTLGFSADGLLTTGTSATRAPWIERAVSVGAQVVRVNVDWAHVAPERRPRGFDPADPASTGYSWAATDGVVRDLVGHGLRVLMTVWDAPSWAEGPHMPRAERAGTWRPDPVQLGQFARAVALRYSGHYPDPAQLGALLPRVDLWQAWNEPNLDYYLSPQWVRAGSGWAAVAPTIYRGLLNAFYAAVKGVASSNLVMIAGTGPYGELLGFPGDPPGQERIQPLAFYRDLLCLHGASLTPVSCRGPAHFDAVDHHPYGVGGPSWHAANPDDVAVPDVYKIARVVRAAVRAGHALPRRPKSVWVSEVGWSSNPPNPQAVPVNEDARWLEQAMYVLWGQGVTAVLPLEIGDPAPIPDYSSVFENGLYYRDGRPKPLARAFRFPFVTKRLSRGRVQLWGRAPLGGQLQVEALRGGGWRSIKRFGVGPQQVFTASVGLAGRAVVRARVGTETSLTWIQGP